MPDPFIDETTYLPDAALFLTLRRNPMLAATLTLTREQQETLLQGLPKPPGQEDVRVYSSGAYGRPSATGRLVTDTPERPSRPSDWERFCMDVRGNVLKNPCLEPDLQVREWSARFSQRWNENNVYRLLGNPNVLPEILEAAVDEYLANPQRLSSIYLGSILNTPRVLPRLVRGILEDGEERVVALLPWYCAHLLSPKDVQQCATHPSDYVRRRTMEAIEGGKLQADPEVVMLLAADPSVEVTDILAKSDRLVWSAALPVVFYQRYAPEDLESSRSQLSDSQREVWDSLVDTAGRQSLEALLAACADVAR